MKRICAAIVFALIATPAFALTGGDVIDKMTDKERAGYLIGAVEMAMYNASTAGNGKRAECISTWYFSQDGKAQKAVVAAFAQYKDRPAVALLNALINRQCGQ